MNTIYENATLFIDGRPLAEGVTLTLDDARYEWDGDFDDALASSDGEVTERRGGATSWSSSATNCAASAATTRGVRWRRLRVEWRRTRTARTCTAWALGTTGRRRPMDDDVHRDLDRVSPCAEVEAVTRVDPLQPDVVVTVPSSNGDVYLASFFANEPQFFGDPLIVERTELLLRNAWLRAKDDSDPLGFTRACERLRNLHPTRSPR